MTHWLKIRLFALMGGALLIGGAYLHAQDDYIPAAKTPEEAAKNFYRFLDIVRQPGDFQSALDEQTLQTLMGSVEHAQFGSLSGGNANAGDKALALIATQAFAPSLDAQVQSSTDGQTVVSVAPSTRAKAREVVVIEEDGGYRVDAVATYGRWNNLSSLDADKALYKKTGWISPLLGQQTEFMGSETNSQCQSNLKQLGLGILQYTQDYDEKMPPARKWREVVYPYVKSQQIFSCPALKTGMNGYANNSKLSGIWLGKISSPAQTVQLYETSNQSDTVFAPFTGRAYRHTRGGVKGMNIEFADGHVKWLPQGKAAQVTINPATVTAGFLTISTRAIR